MPFLPSQLFSLREAFFITLPDSSLHNILSPALLTEQLER